MAILFTNTPDDFASVFEPLSYSVSNTQNKTLSAEILTSDSNSPIGIKRIPAANTASFNIAAYLRRQIKPSPFSSNAFGLFSDKGRFVSVVVKCDSAISPVRTFTGATSSLHENTLLSDISSRRSISWKDNGEISLLVPDSSLHYSIKLSGSKSLSFSSSEYIASRGIVSLCISMSMLHEQLIKKGFDPNNYSSMSVEISNPLKSLAVISYDINPLATDSDTRLCWLNKFGALDYFSFSNPLDSAISVTKDRFLNHDGFSIASISASTLYRVSSGFLPAKLFAAVAYIISSPKVWMVQNSMFIPVDITSDNLHFSPLSANSVDFTFRPAKPNVCQNF